VQIGTPLPDLSAIISPENASALAELARWGKGPISQVLWSPNGKQVAVRSAIGIHFYNADSLAQTLFIDDGGSSNCMAFSSDSGSLAVGLDDGTLKVWDVSDGRLVQTLPGDKNPVTSVAFSPDGKLLASASTDGTVRLWGAW
jgi:WD40 repeat protein